MKLILSLTTAFLALVMTSSAATDLKTIPLKDINGKDTSLKAYDGKVLLIVNVASKCGYTPQYKSLESTYRKFKDQGLEVLGFPCNQFAKQDPKVRVGAGRVGWRASPKAAARLRPRADR